MEWYLEGSHSGLVHHLGKVARCKSLRGFKSLPLRKNSTAKAVRRFCRRERYN